MVLRLFRLKTRCCDALKVVPESLRLVPGILVGMIGTSYAICSTDGRQPQSGFAGRQPDALPTCLAVFEPGDALGRHTLSMKDKDKMSKATFM